MLIKESGDYPPQRVTWFPTKVLSFRSLQHSCRSGVCAVRLYRPMWWMLWKRRHTMALDRGHYEAKKKAMLRSLRRGPLWRRMLSAVGIVSR